LIIEYKRFFLGIPQSLQPIPGWNMNYKRLMFHISFTSDSALRQSAQFLLAATGQTCAHWWTNHFSEYNPSTFANHSFELETLSDRRKLWTKSIYINF